MAVTSRGVVARAGDVGNLRQRISSTATQPSLYLYGIVCTAIGNALGFAPCTNYTPSLS